MRQVRVVEMNASELPMTCRKEPLGDVESAPAKQREESSVLAGWHPAYRQHDRNTSFRMERGNLSSRCQGSGAQQKHCERLSTDAGHRGRWLRNSDEAPVMGVERRGPVVEADLSANRVIGRSP